MDKQGRSLETDREIVFLEAFGGLQQDLVWNMTLCQKIAQIYNSDLVGCDVTKFCSVSIIAG